MLTHRTSPTLGEIRAAQLEGQRAGAAGEPVSANPYPFTTELPRRQMHAANQQHLAWATGWRAAVPRLRLHGAPIHFDDREAA